MTSALVSGGKDSVYSAYLADQQGWNVEELLVLVPEDIDSFLFHTPNLSLVELQGRAWGKRVRSIPIRGTGESVEAEALAIALSQGTGAVVAGAIESAYQWGRLQPDHERPGATALRPAVAQGPGTGGPRGDLRGLDIRLVQVAAEPLEADLLGRRLDLALLGEIEEIGRTRRAVHPAGEGGEYETLVVDAPFFRERLEIDEHRTVTRGFAARLEITRARLAPKTSRSPAVR